jgi:hypothetical protein
VIDGETDDPCFLHGINGEDYFSFAWFGTGHNDPYTESVDTTTGRIRLHLENPYPFRKSMEISFGTLDGLSTRSVAFWYQDSPTDLTLRIEDVLGLDWSVFGPVPVPFIPGTGTPDCSNADSLFAALPSEKQLDAGEPIKAKRKGFRCLQEGTFNGWARQRAFGPNLNLSYIHRHVMKISPSWAFIGYDRNCMMARTEIVSAEPREAIIQISYDDPLDLRLNDQTIFSDLSLHEGFVTKHIAVHLKAGRNVLLARMLNTGNVDCFWAGISLRILETDPAKHN